jgi:hypothetical protein
VAVVIAEIVTEVVVGPPPAEAEERAAEPEREELVETVVRHATERVLEILRREWDE